VAVVKPDQVLAGMHQLIVADHDLGDESGNMRRDWSAVAADIRVICTLDEAAGRPPILRVPRGSAGDDQRADDQGRPSRHPPQAECGAAGWLEIDNDAVYCCLP